MSRSAPAISRTPNSPELANLDSQIHSEGRILSVHVAVPWPKQFAG